MKKKKKKRKEKWVNGDTRNEAREEWLKDYKKVGEVAEKKWRWKEVGRGWKETKKRRKAL